MATTYYSIVRYYNFNNRGIGKIINNKETDKFSSKSEDLIQVFSDYQYKGLGPVVSKVSNNRIIAESDDSKYSYIEISILKNK